MSGTTLGNAASCGRLAGLHAAQEERMSEDAERVRQ
jgi:hypothetical protein